MIHMTLTEINVGVSDPSPEDLVTLTFQDPASSIQISLVLDPDDRQMLAERLLGRPAIMVPRMQLTRPSQNGG